MLAAHDGATSSKYKDRIRQLYLNLRDPKNPGLREGLVSGDTPAARFAGMTSAEMASAERQAADDKIKADNLFGALSAHEQQAETDAFQCGRCKQVRPPRGALPGCVRGLTRVWGCAAEVQVPTGADTERRRAYDRKSSCLMGLSTCAHARASHRHSSRARYVPQ